MLRVVYKDILVENVDAAIISGLYTVSGVIEWSYEILNG